MDVANKKIHFIGIAGVGMSALAVMLKDMGAIITGSDYEFYEPTLSYLKRWKIKILFPYRKENIPENVDLIIIGKHAKLNEVENEEVREAFLAKKKVMSFPEVLSELTAKRENIIVAGSYGKSTCAALLTWCLIKSGLKIGYFLGAMPVGLSKNARIGKEKFFVLEGDEYPAFGGVSKFLYLHPNNLLLISGEHDHINVFPTEQSYIEPYKKLVRLLPSNGLLVANINNKNVKNIVSANSKTRIATYGLGKISNQTGKWQVTWHARNIQYGKESIFDLYKDKKKIIKLKTILLGKHNIENIIGVSSFLLEKKLLTKEQLKKTIKTFNGLVRRLDLKTKKSSVLVYEGFGSSYTKAKTALEAMKLHFPNKRLITIFEPHTFGWRNKKNLHWYHDVFKDSKETIILEPPKHGSNTHEQATIKEILLNIKNAGNVYSVCCSKDVFKILKKLTQKDDLILLLSSGEMFNLIKTIPIWVEKNFPKNKKQT